MVIGRSAFAVSLYGGKGEDTDSERYSGLFLCSQFSEASPGKFFGHWILPQDPGNKSMKLLHQPI